MNRRQFLATTTAGAGLAAMPASALAVGNADQFLDIQGNQIVNDGKAIRLRGTNCYNVGEVWVHPPGGWLWLMCDLYEPAQPVAR